MHEAIKKLYPKLTSTTSTEDGKRVIKVMLSKFAGGSYIHKYIHTVCTYVRTYVCRYIRAMVLM